MKNKKVGYKKGIVTALGVAALGFEFSQITVVKADVNGAINNTQDGIENNKGTEAVKENLPISNSDQDQQKNQQILKNGENTEIPQQTNVTALQNVVSQDNNKKDSSKEEEVNSQPNISKMPAIVETDQDGASFGTAQRPIHATVQMSATNSEGTSTTKTEKSNLLIDSDAKNINTIYKITNTSKDDQNAKNLKIVLCLPSYYQTPASKNVLASNNMSLNDLTKNLPKGVSLTYSTEGGFFNAKTYEKLIKDSPKFKWSDLQEIVVNFDNTEIKGNSDFAITVPMEVVKPIDIYNRQSIFEVGVSDNNFSEDFSRYVRFVKPSGKLVANKPYNAVEMITENEEYKELPNEIQALMPSSNVDDMTVTTFQYSEPVTGKSIVYTGDVATLDVEKAGIPEIFKDKGYSVLLLENNDDEIIPQQTYYFVDDNSKMKIDPASPNENSSDILSKANPFFLVALRKVIDTKDLTLKVGDKWSDTDNFVSGIDDYEDPIDINNDDDFTIKVNDPDNIMKDGKAIKNGQLTVTYSYKISDTGFGKSEPYIVSRIANVKVSPENMVSHSSHHQVSSSSHGITGNSAIKYHQQLLSTYSNVPETKLYDSQGQLVTNRALGKDTSWYSDQEKSIGNETYYRVATSEWVKASSVYTYENKQAVIETKSIQKLFDFQGRQITNRELAAGTSWKIDCLAYINNKAYYRVATNEFVPVIDVSIV